MPLIQLVIVLVVVGVVLWLINSLHTDASYTEENLECGSGYCSYYLAFECLWSHRKHLSNSYREVKSLIIVSIEFKQSNCECMKGMSSEAASLAGQLELGKLICLFSNNHVTLFTGSNIASI